MSRERFMRATWTVYRAMTAEEEEHPSLSLSLLWSVVPNFVSISRRTLGVLLSPQEGQIIHQSEREVFKSR